jgi:heat shock protein HtpX
VVAAVEVLVVALPLALVAWLATPLPWWLAAGLAVALGVLAVSWWWRTAPARIVAALGGAPADERRHARLHNLVDGLCLSFGVRRPQLQVLDVAAPNIATVASAHGATVICTAGLLEHLDRVALEGVIAHELAHIRSGQAASATSAAALVGLPLLGGGGPVARRLAPVGEALAPLRCRLLGWVVGPGREHDADRAAVAVTRYPPGLSRALTIIRDQAGPVPTASPATVPLWIQDPRPDVAGRPALHPPIDERIDVLGEL